MPYGNNQKSLWIDDVRSGVYQIRLISKVAVYGGKTVGPEASLWIILGIRGRLGLVSEDIQRILPCRLLGTTSSTRRRSAAAVSRSPDGSTPDGSGGRSGCARPGWRRSCDGRRSPRGHTYRYSRAGHGGGRRRWP